MLDTTGELARVYAVGAVAFVGGTLAPYGGHDPLEQPAPASPDGKMIAILDAESGAPVKVFRYDGSQVIEWFSLDAYGDLGLTRGANIAGGYI